MAVYTQSYLNQRVNSRIHNKIGLVPNSMEELNTAVGEAWTDIYFKSAKRWMSTAPRLFTNIYEYPCPTDLHGRGISDLPQQAGNRYWWDEWEQVPEPEFSLRKNSQSHLVAIRERELGRTLLIDSWDTDNQTVITPFDTTTSSGTWTAVGDATNLRADTSDFVEGAGALEFDLSSGGLTTAGVQATNVTSFDLTDYLSAGSGFVRARITSTTNLTNYKLRIGSSSSNYYEMTVTTQNDLTALVNGWNLLKFDLTSRTTTGTPVVTACTYVDLFMTKTAGKISEVGYAFDNLVLHKGIIHNVIYYSSYPWQSSSGTWKENATASDDYLNVTGDEFNVIVEKCVEYIGNIAREYADADRAAIKYKEQKAAYQGDFPAQIIPEISTTYNFASVNDPLYPTSRNFPTA